LKMVARTVASLLLALPLLSHGGDVAKNPCRLETLWEDSAGVQEKCRRLADQGDLAAQTYVGLMYREGQGVARDDEEAIQWLKKAAEQGLAEAQTLLGIVYDDIEGWGVTRDEKAALKWFKTAAEQGYAPAQFILGEMYLSGRIAVQDKEEAWNEGMKEAARWFRKSAEQGLPEAQTLLGILYVDAAKGIGSVAAQDEAQALKESVKWFRKALRSDAIGQPVLLAYGKSRLGVQDKASMVRRFKTITIYGFGSLGREHLTEEDIAALSEEDRKLRGTMKR